MSLALTHLLETGIFINLFAPSLEPGGDREGLPAAGICLWRLATLTAVRCENCQPMFLENALADAEQIAGPLKLSLLHYL